MVNTFNIITLHISWSHMEFNGYFSAQFHRAHRCASRKWNLVFTILEIRVQWLEQDIYAWIYYNHWRSLLYPNSFEQCSPSVKVIKVAAIRDHFCIIFWGGGCAGVYPGSLSVLSEIRCRWTMQTQTLKHVTIMLKLWIFVFPECVELLFSKKWWTKSSLNDVICSNRYFPCSEER